MAKLTYSEQLKHPNWQRRRLEVLQAARFQCEMCGNDQLTLHVHHKRYVKGREVWEYETRELQALCEDCHAEHHSMHKLLEEILALSDDWNPLRTALGLTAGYMTAAYSLDKDLAERARAEVGVMFDIGVAAFALAVSSAPDIAAALDTIHRNSVNGPVLDALIDKWRGSTDPGPIKEG